MKVSITLSDEQVEFLKSVSVDDFPKYVNDMIGTHIALVKSALHRQEEELREKSFDHFP
jgi:hypothetical protein